jgi:N-methylhydantoinase A
VYDRARLRSGHRIAGPAVIEQFDATTLLLPAQEAIVDDLGFLVIREQERPAWTA